jgi:hypothetical protein
MERIAPTLLGRYGADRLEIFRKFLGGPKIHLIIAASNPHVFEPH